MFFMCHARVAFAGAITIRGAFARGQKGFPRDARGIIDPGLLRFSVAAGGLTLFDDIAARLSEPRINFLQLIGVLNLNTEVIEARLSAPR